jgi:hypothetical protein
VVALMSTEVRRWRATTHGGRPMGPRVGFDFFYSFLQLFIESQIVLTTHPCREYCFKLMAKSSLPAKLCHERYVGGNSRQLVCRE